MDMRIYLPRLSAIALAGASLLAVTAAQAKEICVWCWIPTSTLRS